MPFQRAPSRQRLSSVGISVRIGTSTIEGPPLCFASRFGAFFGLFLPAVGF